MVVLTIQFLYGSFTLGFLIFLFILYKNLTEFFLYEAMFEENRDDDDTDFENPVDIEEDEEGVYDRMLSSKDLHFYLEEISFYLLRFSYLFGLAWLAGFFGLSLFFSFYFSSIFFLYAYSFFNSFFKGTALYSTARLDFFDPRPGFSADSVVLSPFVHLDSINFLSKKFSSSNVKVGLFSPIETSLRNRSVSDPLFKIFYNEPSFFSKSSYFYLQFYILSSIHGYWKSVFKNNSSLFVGNTTSISFNSSVDSSSSFSLHSYAFLVKPETLFSASQVLLSRFVSAESFKLFSALNFPSPFEKLSVFVDPNKISFPFYRTRPFLLDLLFSNLSGLLIRFSLYVISKQFFLSANSKGTFDRDTLSSYFRLFPSSYFYSWASLFFSSRLDYVSFRFKDLLVPEDWQAANVFNTISFKFPKFSPLNLFLRNKVFGLGVFRDLLVRNLPSPVSSGSKYYFVKGYLNFYTSDVLRLIRNIESSYLYNPIRKFFMDFRYKNKQIEAGSYLSLRRSGYSAFSIRSWVGHSGDGLEPFISPSAFFLFKPLNFIQSFGTSTLVRSRFFSFLFSRKPSFFCLPLDLPKSPNTFFYSDPSWKFLEKLVSHSPNLYLYMKDLAYGGYSSDFSENFFKKYPEFLSSNVHKQALTALSAAARLRFQNLRLNAPSLSSFSNSLFFSCFRSSFLSKRPSPNVLIGSGLSKSLKCRRNKFHKSKLITLKNRFKVPSQRFAKKVVRVSFQPVSRYTSLWSLLKMRRLDLPEFNNFRIRSGLRLLVRDPFGPYSRKAGSRFIRLRRFFWRTCFEVPARAALMLTSGASFSSRFNLISKYVFLRLEKWLCSSFSLNRSFLIYLLSDFSLITRYFLIGTPHSLKSAQLWSLVWSDPFLVASWKSFFSCFFSQQGSFFTSFLRAGPLPSVSFGTGAYASLRFSIDRLECLRFAIFFRDFLLLNLPNRLLSRLAFKSSVSYRGVSFRGDWKSLCSTLSALFYTTFSSLLKSNFRDFVVSPNSLQLLKTYAGSSADYSYFVRYLFPSFSDPFLNRSLDQYKDYQDEQSIFDFTDRLFTTDLTQAFPSESFLEHASNILASFNLESFSSSKPLLSHRTVHKKFLHFLFSPWTLADKQVFFSSAFSFLLAPSVFGSLSTRYEFLRKFSCTGSFFLSFFKREYLTFLDTEIVDRVLNISFYSDELEFNGDIDLLDEGEEFYEVGDDFFDLGFNDDEETFEIEEEGTEDEEMLDQNRMLSSSHPNIEEFDNVFNNEVPFKLSPVPWSVMLAQPYPLVYHERVSFFSSRFVFLRSFLLTNLQIPFTFFSVYCFFKNFTFFFSDREFFEDYLRPYLFGGRNN